MFRCRIQLTLILYGEALSVVRTLERADDSALVSPAEVKLNARVPRFYISVGGQEANAN